MDRKQHERLAAYHAKRFERVKAWTPKRAHRASPAALESVGENTEADARETMAALDAELDDKPKFLGEIIEKPGPRRLMRDRQGRIVIWLDGGILHVYGGGATEAAFGFDRDSLLTYARQRFGSRLCRLRGKDEPAEFPEAAW